MICCDPNVLLLTKQLLNSTHPPTLHIGRLTWPWYFSMKLHGHESLPAKQHHWVCFLSPCNWLRYVRCWLFAQLPTHCTWSTSSLFGDTWLQYSLFPSIHECPHWRLNMLGFFPKGFTWKNLYFHWYRHTNGSTKRIHAECVHGQRDFMINPCRSFTREWDHTELT